LEDQKYQEASVTIAWKLINWSYKRRGAKSKLNTGEEHETS
jgi:hypothetical protein